MNAVYFLCSMIVFLSSAYTREIVEFNSVSIEIINKVTSERHDVQLSLGKKMIFENMLIHAKKCVFDSKHDVSYVLMEISFINEKKIFDGWLSSDSISLNSVQNSIYDVNIISNCY